MRALAPLLAATLCACRPDVGAANPALAASVRIRVGVPSTAAVPPPATPVEPVTSASSCFAEPVVYDKKIVPPPITGESLRRCDDLPEDAGAECRFAVARELFDAKHFERAGPLFLALAHEPRAWAGYAARLAFESMNMLAIHADPGRPACYDLMAEEVPKLLTEQCTPAPRAGAEEACAMLLLMDIDVVSCSECTRGTLSGRDRDSSLVEAARIYLQLATEQCIFGKGRQARNEERRCDEMLFSAHNAFERGKDPGGAAQARRLLLDPKNGFQRTDGAKRLMALEQRRREARRAFEQLRGR